MRTEELSIQKNEEIILSLMDHILVCMPVLYHFVVPKYAQD